MKNNVEQMREWMNSLNEGTQQIEEGRSTPVTNQIQKAIKNLQELQRVMDIHGTFGIKPLDVKLMLTDLKGMYSTASKRRA